MSTNSAGKVVVVGSINQDLTTYSPSLPQPGETLLGTDFVTSAGGKGSNQAVAAASIGIVQGTDDRNSGVYMIGRVGNDDMGRSLLQGLSSRKVNIGEEESCVSGAHTGVASIVVDTTTGQNTIVVAPGANLALKPEEVSSSLTKILADTGDAPNVVLVQLEISANTALEALKTAKKFGAINILNPAPAKELSNEWYPLIDILIPNESELASLCGISNGDEGGVTGEGEEAMAKALLDRGVQQAVIVTLGSRGAMIVRRNISRKRSLNDVDESTGDDDFETIMISEPDDLPCKSQPVVDAVGAGDAFCGGLAAYLSRGVELDRAASMACGVASMSVRKRGAQESYPRENELPACLRLDTNDEMEVEKNDKQKTTITFVTGNKNKLAEVRRLLLTSSQGDGNSNELPFDIDSAKIDLPELQGTPHDIAIEKCRLAAEQIKSPVMIEDTSLCFYDLNDLPGPYIKWFLDGIGLEGK
jgi:ribokinase